MPDLVTIAEAKDYVGLKTSDRDVLLKTLVSAASDRFRSLCSRNIEQRTYSEVRNGNGRTVLRLFNPPVSGVPTVTENGVSLVVATSYNPAADVVASLDDGVLTRQMGTTPIGLPFGGFAGRWSPGTSNVVVVYQGGYAAVPEDVKAVVKEMVGMMFRHVDRREIGVDQLTDASGGSVRLAADLPKWCREIVGIYSLPRVPET